MASFTIRGTGLQVAIRRKGYRPIYRTFDNTPDGLAQAKDWVADIEHKINRGKYVDGHEGRTTTLSDALLRYLSEITPHKKGAKQERNRILALAETPLASRVLAEVRSTDIAQYRDELVADGYAPSTIKNNLTIISQVYTIAIAEWGITEIRNPVENVRRPRTAAGRERRLEYGEEEKLLETLETPYREMLIISLETAMRRSEVCGLKWSDIDLRRRVAVLRDTKNGTGRAVPLSTRAVQALAGMVRDMDRNALVFGKKPDSYTHAFMDACKFNKIEGLRLHDIRHEATSRLFELGTLDIVEIAKITGHKGIGMLMHYTHLEAGKLANKLG